jgi:hypothetical protein
MIPAETPPGEYVIRTGLYRRDSGQRLPVSGTNAQLGPDYVELARFTVKARR